MNTEVYACQERATHGGFSKFIKRSLSVSSFEDFQVRYSYPARTQEEDRQIDIMYTTNQKQRPQVASSIKECDIISGFLMKSQLFRTNFKHISDAVDIAIRMVLLIVFCKMETTPAFRRIIHMEEVWLYKNPRTEDYVSGFTLLVSVILGPFAVTLLYLVLTKDRGDFRSATWAWTLCLGCNGLITSLLKVIVGRPRPDYFFRCFPDGVMHISQVKNGVLPSFNCTGNEDDINEGYKSFPSGHSSFAFAAYGFITFYVGAKLHAFNRQGRGESWRFCISVAPLIVALLVAVSRTCDYHHHWQDVVFGSTIGLTISYITYRQYYPSIFTINCHRTYPRDIYAMSTTQKSCITKQYPGSLAKHLCPYKQLPSEENGDNNICHELNNESNEFKKRIKLNQKTEHLLDKLYLRTVSNVATNE